MVLWVDTRRWQVAKTPVADERRLALLSRFALFFVTSIT